MVVLLLGAVGCSGGSRHAPLPVSEMDDGSIPISWSSTGTLAENELCPMEGAWNTYDDCATAPLVGLPCTERDPALTGPEGQLGFSVSAERVCTKGILQQVVDQAYNEMWGAEVTLEFAGPSGEHAFDAEACGGTGFRFDIEARGSPGDLMLRFRSRSDPLGENRVTVPLPGNDTAVHFDDVTQGQDSMAAAPSPDAIYSLSFRVAANGSAPKPFDFCISDLRLLPAEP